MTDTILPLGNSPELHQTLFSLRPGELSQPIQIDSGFVILTPKNISQAHQATLAEVHDNALADYQHEKSLDLARSRAEELSKRVRAGEDFDKVAEFLGSYGEEIRSLRSNWLDSRRWHQPPARRRLYSFRRADRESDSKRGKLGCLSHLVA